MTVTKKQFHINRFYILVGCVHGGEKGLHPFFYASSVVLLALDPPIV